MIYKPMMIKYTSKKMVLMIVLICSILSLLWCVFPLFGWSYYSLEGAGTSCSVEWNERSFNVISYNIAMFIFVFFIPLIVIIGANTKIILIVIIYLDFLFEK